MPSLRNAIADVSVGHANRSAHRGQVMRKMKAESLPHLVRMAARLDLVPYDETAEFG